MATTSFWHVLWAAPLSPRQRWKQEHWVMRPFRRKPHYSKAVAEKLFYPGIYSLVEQSGRVELLDQAWDTARAHIPVNGPFHALDERRAIAAAKRVLAQ